MKSNIHSGLFQDCSGCCPNACAHKYKNELSLFTDFENFSVFKPAAQQEKAVGVMLDQVIAWGGALKNCGSKHGLVVLQELL